MVVTYWAVWKYPRNDRNLDFRSSIMQPIGGISARLNMPLFFILSGDKPKEWRSLLFNQKQYKIQPGYFFLSPFSYSKYSMHCHTMNIILNDCCSKISCLREANNPLNPWDKYSNSFCLNWLPWSSCLFLPGLTSFDTLCCSSLWDFN